MKTRFVALLVVALFVIASAQQAFAQSTPKADKREHNQQARIKQGVKSGELTKREAVKLEKEQAKIRVEEKAMKADGKVTAAERAKLQYDQNKASKRIYKQKHDKQERK